MSAGSAVCARAFSETKVGEQHVQMEAETGNLNIGMREASVLGFERAGLNGFIFAVSILCVIS